MSKTYTDSDDTVRFSDGTEVGPFYNSESEEYQEPKRLVDGKLMTMSEIRAQNPNLEENKNK